jgi:hypothetical protein
MNLDRVSVSISLLGAVLLLSCAPEPAKTAADTAKPVEKKEVVMYTAQPCLARMAQMAQRWRSDALPYHLQSVSNAEDNGQDGKSTVWRADFASPGAGQSKPFSCSGSRLRESPPTGVTADREYPIGAAVTFSLTDFNVDSDAVAKLAMEHGGADLVKKNPNQPVYYELGFDPKAHKLLWAAVYGSDQKDAKLVGIVDASTPKFIGVLNVPKH